MSFDLVLAVLFQIVVMINLNFKMETIFEVTIKVAIKSLKRKNYKTGNRYPSGRIHRQPPYCFSGRI